jgi:hypothetical protein
MCGIKSAPAGAGELYYCELLLVDMPARLLFQPAVFAAAARSGLNFVFLVGKTVVVVFSQNSQTPSRDKNKLYLS